MRRRRQRATAAAGLLLASLLVFALIDVTVPQAWTGRQSADVRSTPRQTTDQVTGTGTGTEMVTASDPLTRVSAEIGLAPREWGTAVSVRVSGVVRGTRCRLIAVGKDGSREVAAGWQIAEEGMPL